MLLGAAAAGGGGGGSGGGIAGVPFAFGWEWNGTNC